MSRLLNWFRASQARCINAIRKFSAAASSAPNTGGLLRNQNEASVPPPEVMINCLRNNIFLHVASPPGKLLFTLSSGLAGFKGAAKTSPKAALAMLDTLQRRLGELGFNRIRVNFRGLNSARAVMVGQLRRMGLSVAEVIDTTGVPFNGCRPPKKRRL